MFTGRMLFLTPNQQCQSTDGNSTEGNKEQNKILLKYTKKRAASFQIRKPANAVDVHTHTEVLHH